MSGIHFLENDDFIVKQGDKGFLLSLTYSVLCRGVTLLLFYSIDCEYCKTLIPVFKQLPQYVNGCQFAMVNVNRNIDVVERSKNTIAPITYVPDLILYVNGSPYVRYDGPHVIPHIQKFIFNANDNIKKTAFMDMDQQNPPMQQQQAQQQQQNPQMQQQQQPQMQQHPQIQQQQQYYPYNDQQPQPVNKIGLNEMPAKMASGGENTYGMKKDENGGIPAYTIGTPLYGEKKREKVCYLNFNTAYVST
jgi:thiol-disulfide isomerase/thioredoxin